MARQKKFSTVNSEQKSFDEKTEVCMSQENELETLQQDIDKARVELEQTKVSIEEKKKEMISLNPRRDHDEKEMSLVAKQVSMSNERVAMKENLEKQKLIDNQKITGKFLNRRAPGQPAKLCYIKYEDDPVKWYTFEDGKVYTIPRGFVEQINEHYHTPHFIQAEGAMDPNRMGSSIHDVDTSNKKYAFVAMGF